MNVGERSRSRGQKNHGRVDGGARRIFFSPAISFPGIVFPALAGARLQTFSAHRAFLPSSASRCVHSLAFKKSSFVYALVFFVLHVYKKKIPAIGPASAESNP